MLLDSSGERPPKRRRARASSKEVGTAYDDECEASEHYHFPKPSDSSSQHVSSSCSNNYDGEITWRLTKRLATVRLNESAKTSSSFTNTDIIAPSASLTPKASVSGIIRHRQQEKSE